MIIKYINRILDDAENAVIEEKNRIHWRNATSEDYFRIAVAYARLEQIRTVCRDLYTILKLYG